MKPKPAAVPANGDAHALTLDEGVSKLIESVRAPNTTIDSLPTARDNAAGMIRFAQTMGILVFVLGVALLVCVFFWTRDLFQSLAAANDAWLLSPIDPATAPGVMDYLPGLFRILTRMALLFLLGYFGSMVAGKGAQMFGATLPQKSTGDKSGS